MSQVIICPFCDKETAFLDENEGVTEAYECPHFVGTSVMDGTMIPSNNGEELMRLFFALAYILEKDCIDLEAFVKALSQDPELKPYADENVFFPGIEELEWSIGIFHPGQSKPDT